MSLISDLSLKIASDSSRLYVTDNSYGWGTDGDAEKADVTGTSVTITNTVLSINYTFTDNVVTGVIEISASDLGFSDGKIDDAIYDFVYSITATPTVDDKIGKFVSYRSIEGNINHDLLAELNSGKSYDDVLDLQIVTDIRRRDNLLFALQSAEYFSDVDNIENLISLLENLE